MARNRHRAEGAAVIGAGETNNPLPPGGAAHGANGRFIGIRAGMTKPDPLWLVRWEKRDQPFGQRRRRGICRRQDRCPRRVSDGGADCGHQRRVAIAKACRAPGRRQVDQRAPVIRAQHRTLAANHRLRKESQLLQPCDRGRIASV